MSHRSGDVSRRAGWAALALLAATIVACGGAGKRNRAAGSAVWTDSSAAPLAMSDLVRLESVGIGELFVDAATLEWDGNQPRVTAVALPKEPRQTRATLVVRGVWPGGEVDENGARALVAGLDGAAQGADGAGLAVAGWLLDLQGVPGKAGAALADSLRAALDPSLLLAVTLPRDGLAAEGIDDVVAATDFAVVFLYGTREGEPDDPGAWDFQRLQTALQSVDALGEPFLAGVVVRGSATVVRAGSDVGEIPATTLADLAWNHQLRVRHGFSLEGVDRQTYGFTADAATRIGETRLSPGDDVRVVGTSMALVQDLHRKLADWKPKHLLGELYYRLPHPGDGLTLSAASLARVADEAVVQPAPRVVVEKLESSPGRVVVRFTLENPSTEGSDLGQVDSNFVEAYAAGGAFGAVQQGGFPRYDLYASGPEGKLVRTIRFPTVLRFFVPLLPPGAHIVSGPVEIHTVREGLSDLAVRASFLTTAGGTAEIQPTSWLALAPTPTPSPTPVSR